ncbi:metallophosphoesterase [Priestia taiwanensis]|uniref:Metallophosphoesterase n=1 Tax=Priestia taiwanensis TaxID=1347902 RepID=A0A917AJR6_9BACI|nr:metallophosphoesterase [Priestia taiwanensis]MBM7361638.1 putative MPP superfamily phosphohydrolase [Priestia taiwanensis]GGE55734.1 metallophosphoesterase [Priestia taiwanensis]
MIYVLIGCTMLLGIVLLTYMYQQAKENNLLTHELEFEHFPHTFGEVNIFFISDIHRRVVSPKLLEKIDKKIDLVIIGGDLAEKGVPISRVKENLTRLKELGPMYFVWGNNDEEVNVKDLDALLVEMNVKVLENTAVHFESYEGEKISLIGVDDWARGRTNLQAAMSDSERGTFRILVSHNPDITKVVEDGHNVSLILSGHTHGGQIRIFGMGPYEQGSVKEQDGCVHVISNGYGTTRLPLRLGAKPQAHLLTLKTKV